MGFWDKLKLAVLKWIILRFYAKEFDEDVLD
jgi:hypothetical protein